jgi:hypothetical protein
MAAARKPTLFAVDLQRKTSQSEAPKRKRRARPPKMPLLALGDAMHTRFRPDEPFDKDFDLERGLRAIALLLDAVSENGNKPVDGSIILGLTESLNLFADRVGRRAGRNK